METVEGMLKKLQLSAAEKKGVRIAVEEDQEEVSSPQAVGKLFSEKKVRAETLIQALGKVWCPLRSLDCQELGGNIFLFTFHQASGKARALDDGPWMLSDEILVMTDMDETKTLEELEFHDIPIWVRVAQLPFGMMNHTTAKVLGDEIGKFVDTDVGPGGKAIGAFLRVKVRIDIRKPLMRGVTVLVGKEGHEVERWCPLTYEFLPDFCFICGCIGHVDKICSSKVGVGVKKQFDRSLRWMPERKRFDDGWRRGGSSSDNSWRSSSTGSRDRLPLLREKVSVGAKRSDVPSWKKNSSTSQAVVSNEEVEAEVNSPMKVVGAEDVGIVNERSGVQKALFDARPTESSGPSLLKQPEASQLSAQDGDDRLKALAGSTREKVPGGYVGELAPGKTTKPPRSFKRVSREIGGKHTTTGPVVEVEKKRGRENEDVVMQEAKKNKVDEEVLVCDSNEAGLQSQLRNTQ